MLRSKITPRPGISQARKSAGDLAVLRADPALVFDLGGSRGSDVANNKDPMIDEAFGSTRSGKRRS
jgi:hypothetical protein